MSAAVSAKPAANAGQPSAEDRRRSRKVAMMVFLPPAILALSLIANGARQASERGNATTVAEQALAKAIKKVPFEVRLPTRLPLDAVLVRTYLDEPDSQQGFQAYQLNTWYRTPGEPSMGGGKTIHVWQSNDKFLARRLSDPMEAAGKPVKIGTDTWHRVTDDRVEGRVVAAFAKRFDDGITMTVDSADPELVLETIKELRLVPVS